MLPEKAFCVLAMGVISYLASSERPESGREWETCCLRRLDARLLGIGNKSPFMMSSYAEGLGRFLLFFLTAGQQAALSSSGSVQ